jgi:ketosteroid isomerase-like protein
LADSQLGVEDGCSDAGGMNIESEIRALLDYDVEATRAKDIDALMRHYVPDALACDVVDPLR